MSRDKRCKSDILNDVVDPEIDAPTFTRDDEISATAYTSNRIILHMLWELADVYDNVAEMIDVKIRPAINGEDYLFDEDFADAAIVVSVEWKNEKDACEKLSCNDKYPLGKSCRFLDSPKYFPSGDDTTVKACQPACYMVNASRINGEISRDNAKSFYNKNVFSVMNNDGVWTDFTTSDKLDEEPPIDVPEDPAKSKIKLIKAPDLPPLSVYENGKCGLADLAIETFVTLPYERSIEHNVCRQDNIRVGDDIVLLDSPREYSGRHSRTYCNVFDKEFLPDKTCSTTWWEDILSYTFVGNAMIRLARMAIHGGDGCSEILPTDSGRKQVDAEAIKSLPNNTHAKWFNSKSGNFVLPPPNVMLSDLGLSGGDKYHYWNSACNGVVACDSPFVAKDSLGELDGRKSARKAMSRRRRDADRKVRKIVAFETDNPNDLIDFDKIYEILGPELGSSVGDLILELLEEFGKIGGVIMFEIIAKNIVKRSFNRLLSFIGSRMFGEMSRKLLAMALRAAAARLVASIMIRFTERMMTALATTASGIGVILGIVEFMTGLLDLAFALGWDPGNYNSEFSNAVFDDLVRVWISDRSRTEINNFDPMLLLMAFLREDKEDVEESEDQSNIRHKMTFDSIEDAPYFFAPFAEAMRVAVVDMKTPDPNAPTGRGKLLLGDDEDILNRLRPYMHDQAMLCSIVWPLHYCKHRKYNSLGQRMTYDDDILTIDDKLIERNVLNNEMGSMLATAIGLPRDSLIGIARRNATNKLKYNSVLLVMITVGFAGLAVESVFGIFFSIFLLIFELITVVFLIEFAIDTNFPAKSFDRMLPREERDPSSRDDSVLKEKKHLTKTSKVSQNVEKVQDIDMEDLPRRTADTDSSDYFVDLILQAIKDTNDTGVGTIIREIFQEEFAVIYNDIY